MEKTQSTFSSKANSIVSSSGTSRLMYGAQDNSARNSMDLIEGTTQHFPPPGQALKSDAHVQRQRWDAFFDPQYSFGAFIHGEEEKQNKHKHQHRKNIDQLVDDGNMMLVKSPTPISRRTSHEFTGAGTGMTTTENSTAAMTPTLPNVLGENGKEKAWGPRDEKTLIERLKLLKKMRAQPIANIFGDNKAEKGGEGEEGKEEDSSDDDEHPASKKIKEETARWKRHITSKAKQLCKEAKKTNDSSSTTSSPDPDADITEKPANNNTDEELGGGQVNTRARCRRSFICFMLGFLFPPVWLFGAFYISSHANRQTSANQRIDHVWRKRSRIAFGIFTISLMIILVIVFVLKPGSVGWRLSKGGPGASAD